MAKYKDFDDEIIFDSGSSNSVKSVRSKKKKKKTWILVVVLVVEFILIVGLLGVLYVVDKLSNIKRTPLNEDLIVINPDIDDDTTEKLKGYTNILLLGTDSRDNSTDGLDKVGENHTDAMLVASINNDSGEVRIISVYRDCLLEMNDIKTDKDFKNTVIDKATEAAFKYGIESTITMINRNLDMDIKDYVMVNWAALIDIVDSVGGVDIEITQMEQRWTNRYLVDTSKATGVSYEELDVYDDDDTKLSDEELSMDSDKMNTRRMAHMDGIQATAFARVRYGDGKADYGRTERQRKVIEQIVAKAKKFDIGRLNSILTAITKNLSTSFDINEILDLATSITKYKLTMVDGGFPFTRNDQIRSKDGWKFADPVIPVTLESNVVKFHEKLFDSTDYTPSTTVKNISEKIIRLTGVYE